jgi:hypothetical protein
MFDWKTAYGAPAAKIPNQFNFIGGQLTRHDMTQKEGHRNSSMRIPTAAEVVHPLAVPE